MSGGADFGGPGRFTGGSDPTTTALLQELIRVLQALSVFTKQNLGSVASGDVTGAYPGPLSVIATHLIAPLPIGQGGTGNTTGQPSGAAGGDLSGTYPNPTVARINGTTLGTTTATSGNILIGSGTQWITNPVSGDATLSSVGALTVVSTHLAAPLPIAQGGTGNATGQPSGTAGGDLSGSYPNPTVARINGATLGTTTATAANILIGSGTQWVTNPVTGDATITSAGVLTVVSTHLSAPLPLAQGGTANTTGQPSGTAGGDLSGSYPNPTVAAINGVALGSTTATAANILIGSGTQWVTHAVSGDATITSAGALTIAANAITTGKINNAAVTYAKIQNETASTLLGNPTGAPAAPSEITLGAPLTFVGSALQTVAFTGDVTTAADSFATSLVAISGQSISPAAWTPVDASGAALVFTAVSGNYTRLGNMVFAYGTVTYPATADGSPAKIGGLPFSAANQPYANIPYVMRNNSGSFGTQGLVLANTNTFTITDIVTTAAKTNANMSGLIVRFMMAYPVA